MAKIDGVDSGYNNNSQSTITKASQDNGYTKGKYFKSNSNSGQDLVKNY